MSPSKRETKLRSLQRRRDCLAERLADWDESRDKGPTARELSALNWALRVVAVAQQEGLLDDPRLLAHDL